MKKKIAVNHTAVRVIKKADFEVSFVATGDIQTIKHGEIFLNQLVGQEIDGSLSQIYLRVFEEDTIRFYPLIGKNSDAKFFIGQSQARWQGRVAEIDFELTLKLADNQLFWELLLDGTDKLVDIVLSQDIGLADEGALRSNEAYNSQYLNHQIFHDRGYTIVSRQNMGVSTGYPVLETGAFGEQAVDGFLTDGFQFFGKSYKLTRSPEVLTKKDFPNEVYQYELALAALKTQSFELNGKKKVVFYQSFQANSDLLPTAVTAEDELQETLSNLSEEELTEVELSHAKLDLNKQLNGRELSNQEVRAYYPISSFDEILDGKLVSGFTTDNVHFVSQAKELLVEREHGEIFLSGNSMSINKRGLATSSFIYGLFNAHIVIGNTTMNKLLSNQRDHLNLSQISGQRIFVKRGDKYQLLGLPSLFEMGYNFARWIYVLDDNTLTVTNFLASDEASLQLEVHSESGKVYDFLITNQVIMDEKEYKSAANLEIISKQSYDFTATETSAVNMGNPKLRYRMNFDQDQEVELLETGSLFDGPTFIEDSLVIFALKSDKFKFKITGNLGGKIPETGFLEFAREVKNYQNFIEKELLNGFRFTSTTGKFEKLNRILPWYAHDMLIHYLSPHGLEQYGGAAWGTRDVSQGPIEFFLATQHPEVAREILLCLFSHQFEEDDSWPQWFMFDEYSEIFSDESHGDVIVWPLFALTEYLEQTGDFEILKEDLPYLSNLTHKFTAEKASLKVHLQKESQYIKDHFLSGTHLSAYGNGDWDDTLQPANSELKEHMTSSWTVALTYQAVKKYAELSQDRELTQLAEAIKSDFEKYLIVDQQIPGFALQHQKEDGSFDPIIHPRDEKTKMHYRLLPLQQSIIAELVDSEQVERNLALIKEHLTFVDGVRLMERSPDYQGGISRNFKRAEQAANFGREIGLLYVHAQIRYVEAMAKAGRAREAWRALEQTIPLGLKDVVENAATRQANVYFSSSDGDFKTRYEAQANFDKLKSGGVEVKSGWRLYSSGPGIFINQVIRHLAGIEMTSMGLIIDPIFPEKTDKLEVDLILKGKMVHFHLISSVKNSVQLDGENLQFDSMSNSYRSAGLKISQESLVKIKNGSVLTVEIGEDL
ncbi:MAG: cellobiose phosphorylase [Streptococcaceae bacterium]|jgi:cellobiose phosphorylase|nr:cellobiose phosphorylase [Streptococcaceae bacterium]